MPEMGAVLERTVMTNGVNGYEAPAILCGMRHTTRQDNCLYRDGRISA